MSVDIGTYFDFSNKPKVDVKSYLRKIGEHVIFVKVCGDEPYRFTPVVR